MLRNIFTKVVSYSVAGAVIVPGFALIGLGGVMLVAMGKLIEIRYDI